MLQYKPKIKKEAEDYMAEANSEKRIRSLMLLIFFVVFLACIAMAGVFLEYW